MSKIKVSCSKCDGSGFLPHYSGIKKGVCFRCKGKGHFMMTEYQYNKHLREQEEIERQLTAHWCDDINQDEEAFKVGDSIKSKNPFIKDVYKITSIKNGQYFTDKGMKIGGGMIDEFERVR